MKVRRKNGMKVTRKRTGRKMKRTGRKMKRRMKMR